jgi:hypothetical protein
MGIVVLVILGLGVLAALYFMRRRASAANMARWNGPHAGGKYYSYPVYRKKAGW